MCVDYHCVKFGPSSCVMSIVTVYICICYMDCKCACVRACVMWTVNVCMCVCYVDCQCVYVCVCVMWTVNELSMCIMLTITVKFGLSLCVTSMCIC